MTTAHLAAWIAFGLGLLAASTIVLIGGAALMHREGRAGGAGRGGRRSGCGADGSRRCGDGAPPRYLREELVRQFLSGEITIGDLRDFYEGRLG